MWKQGSMLREMTKSKVDKMRLALACFAVILLCTSTVEAQYAQRSTRQVAWAIKQSHGGRNLPTTTRISWAKKLIETAKEYNFDPITGWALIDHESHWRTGGVGDHGVSYGLGQIQWIWHPACKEDQGSDACQVYKANLKNPLFNIETMGTTIARNRTFCKKLTGRSPTFAGWLYGYGGYPVLRSKQGKIIQACNRRLTRTAKGWVWKELKAPREITRIINARKSMLAKLRRAKVS